MKLKWRKNSLVWIVKDRLSVTIELIYRAGIGFCLYKCHIDFRSVSWFLAIHSKLLHLGCSSHNNSNWKKFHSRCSSRMSNRRFFILLFLNFIFSLLSIIRHKYFICILLNKQGHISHYRNSRMTRFQRSFNASIFVYFIENIN